MSKDITAKGRNISAAAPTIPVVVGKRRKAILCGNCTAMAMAEILHNHPPFNVNYEIVFSKGVFLLSEEEKYKLLDLAETADLLIHQPIINFAPANSHDLVSKAKNALVISYPVPYFTGYFPDITYLKRPDDGKIVHDPIDYHSRIILTGYLNRFSVRRTSELFSSISIFPGGWFMNQTIQSLEQLTYRELDLDIHIVDYIMQNYQDRQLFYSMNHPTAELLFFIIDSILCKLDLPKTSLELKMQYSKIFSDQQWPICKAAVRELNLNFQNKVVVNKKEISIYEFVNMYFDYYSQFPEIAEFNKGLIYEDIFRAY